MQFGYARTCERRGSEHFHMVCQMTDILAPVQSISLMNTPEIQLFVMHRKKGGKRERKEKETSNQNDLGQPLESSLKLKLCTCAEVK